MRRVRYLLVGLLSVVLAFAFWYRTRPVLVLLADGLFVQTEWAQGNHDLVLPLLAKGWRFKLVRVDRLPEEIEALHDLMDRQEADVLVIVDFKTDRISPENAPAQAETHRLQLELYARAAEKIFVHPVKECWVWFLTAETGVKL